MPPRTRYRANLHERSDYQVRCAECDLSTLVCRHCKADLPALKTSEFWVQQEIGQWVLAYRLIEDTAGQPVVAEARVFPRDPAAPRPGYWSGVREVVPQGGVPSSALRSLSVTEPVKAGIEQWRRLGRTMMLEAGFVKVAQEAPNSASTSRQGHSAGFLTEVAERYVAICNAGVRSPYEVLRQRLAAENIHYATDTVKDFVKAARREGLLTPSAPGRAGGALTEKAMGLLEQQLEDEDYLRRRSTWIWMRHDITGGRSKVTQLAFDLAWQPHGWYVDDNQEDS